MNKENIAIIGAGVIGLTTAIEAQRAGFKNVTIYAEKPPLETTSAKAGAVFEPYKPGNMSTDDMLSFVRTGLEKYREIIDRNSESQTGIRSHDLYSTSTGELDPDTIPFLPAIPNWELLHAPNIPGEYTSALLLKEVPFIDPTKALPFLTSEFLRRDGEIKKPHRKIIGLEEFVEHTPETIIFNCSGLGAKELCKDDEIHPMRGQIAILGYTPNWDWSVLGDDGYYIFPRMNETVLGGTTELDVWDEQPEASTIDRIIEKARRIMPEIKKEDIIRTYAGLRPFRESGAKIAAEKMYGKVHVQNIGFGGSGWTFCWGAAEKAIRLITGDSILDQSEEKLFLEPSPQP